MSLEPLLTADDLEKLTHHKRRTIKRAVDAGTFPPPIKLSPDSRIGLWTRASVEQWMRSQERIPYQAQAE